MTMTLMAQLSSIPSLALSCLVAFSAPQAIAQDQVPGARRLPSFEMQQEKVNAWTVGVAAGLIEGVSERHCAVWRDKAICEGNYILSHRLIGNEGVNAFL